MLAKANVHTVVNIRFVRTRQTTEQILNSCMSDIKKNFVFSSNEPILNRLLDSFYSFELCFILPLLQVVQLI